MLLSEAATERKKVVKSVQTPSIPVDDSEFLLNTVNLDESPTRIGNFQTVFQANNFQTSSFGADLNSFANVPASNQSEGQFNKYRIWILILLALFTRYISFIEKLYANIIEVDVSFMKLKRIFVPFALYEIIDVIFLKSQVKPGGFLPMLAMFVNLNARQLEKVLGYFQVISRFFQDMLLYFFAFAVCDLLINIVFDR